MEAAGKHYSLMPDAEVTIEANPGTLDNDRFRAYREAGINRLSIGLQAWQNHLLEFLGRIHTASEFDEAVFMAQDHGFSNINADIIFGIPYQTMDDWLETISRVLSCRIPHVSCYSLTVEEGTRFGRLKQEGIWPEPEEDLEREMYRAAIEAFGEAGFEQYEISNMAKPQYRCRHNMNYWLRGEYLGFGVAAHSFFNQARFANTSDLRLYMESVERGNAALSEYYHISNEEALSESMILGLRLTEGVDLDQLSSVYRTDVRKKYGKKLADLADRELVELNGSVVRLTKRGMDFANQVFVEFI
jgi:oxygen-independent coproporphyrinogen-3 oxidase